MGGWNVHISSALPRYTTQKREVPRKKIEERQKEARPMEKKGKLLIFNININPSSGGKKVEERNF